MSGSPLSYVSSFRRTSSTVFDYKLSVCLQSTHLFRPTPFSGPVSLTVRVTEPLSLPFLSDPLTSGNHTCETTTSSSGVRKHRPTALGEILRIHGSRTEVEVRVGQWKINSDRRLLPNRCPILPILSSISSLRLIVYLKS